MSNENPSITMKDIARELGVSVATVSRALKNSPRISKEKREQIQNYAREHNFTPNILAESLRTSRTRPTKMIGVIIPHYTDFYFSSVLNGIDDEATARGYVLMVAQSGTYEREVDICKRFYENKVCGIIVSQAKDTTHYEHFQKLIDARMPLIFYDRICTGVDASRVVVDDYQGTYNAVKHMIETGCRHIAFFGSPQNLEISKNRLNGYRDALLQNGLRPEAEFIKLCDNRPDAEVVAYDMLTQDDHIPDAFFAVNDETAIGILSTAKRLGYRIPQDISICGFSNSIQGTACDPMLTTVEQRGLEIGRQAANILIDKVEGNIPMEKVEKRVVRTRLIVRDSTR